VAAEGPRRVQGDVQSLFEDHVIDRRSETNANDVGGLDEPPVTGADAAQRFKGLWGNPAALELHDDLVAMNC
jgi:hypothetical protein